MWITHKETVRLCLRPAGVNAFAFQAALPTMRFLRFADILSQSEEAPVQNPTVAGLHRVGNPVSPAGSCLASRKHPFEHPRYVKVSLQTSPPLDLSDIYQRPDNHVGQIGAEGCSL